MSDYYHWTFHGESMPKISPVVCPSTGDQPFNVGGNKAELSPYEEMVKDIAGRKIGGDLD